MPGHRARLGVTCWPGSDATSCRRWCAAARSPDLAAATARRRAARRRPRVRGCSILRRCVPLRMRRPDPPSSWTSGARSMGGGRAAGGPGADALARWRAPPSTSGAIRDRSATSPVACRTRVRVDGAASWSAGLRGSLVMAVADALASRGPVLRTAPLDTAASGAAAAVGVTVLRPVAEPCGTAELHDEWSPTGRVDYRGPVETARSATRRPHESTCNARRAGLDGGRCWEGQSSDHRALARHHRCALARHTIRKRPPARGARRRPGSRRCCCQ